MTAPFVRSFTLGLPPQNAAEGVGDVRELLTGGQFAVDRRQGGDFIREVLVVDKARLGADLDDVVRKAAYVCAVENAILQSVASGQAVDFPQYLKDNNASFLLEGVYA